MGNGRKDDPNVSTDGSALNSHEPDQGRAEGNETLSVDAQAEPDASTPSEDQLEPQSEDEQPVVKPDDRPVTSQRDPSGARGQHYRCG